MISAKRGVPLLLCGLFFLMIDQLSKWLVQSYLPLMDSLIAMGRFVYPYGGIGVFESLGGIEFSIVYATNKGAAWGVLTAYQYPLLAVRILFVIGMILYLALVNRHRRIEWPLLLIITGALGNIIDSLVYGHVVDMFYFIFWNWSYPVFNVADSLICIGVVWLMLLSFFKPRPSTA
jgi:signal peptidase II